MTEQDFRHHTDCGTPIRFAPSSVDRSIHAAWLIEADTPMELQNAIIEGDLRLCNSRVQHRWIFEGCKFTGMIDISGTSFASPVRFDGCECEQEVRMDRCRFLNGLICNPF